MVVGFITSHNQCLSPLTLWGVLDTLFDKVCRWLATGLEFFPDTPVSSTDKTDRHDISEILLKVALSTITTNIYNMARSHEGRDSWQYIFIPNFISNTWHYGHENDPKIHLFDLDIQGIWRSWWYITHHLMIIQLHTKYHTSMTKDKKVTAMKRKFP